jgi:hypothetical protein
MDDLQVGGVVGASPSAGDDVVEVETFVRQQRS